MPDAESPFRIGHFPYPYYPRTRILSGDITVLWINTGGGLKQKHKKKQPFGDASAAHLSLVLRYV